jgi:hypothetical protein
LHVDRAQRDLHSAPENGALQCPDDGDLPPVGVSEKVRDAGLPRSAPLDVLAIRDDVARDIYRYDLLLVRPDLHVVWRGNQIPENAEAIAAVATGQEKTIFRN